MTERPTSFDQQEMLAPVELTKRQLIYVAKEDFQRYRRIVTPGMGVLALGNTTPSICVLAGPYPRCSKSRSIPRIPSETRRHKIVLNALVRPECQHDECPSFGRASEP
jgi:hypothetical protein